MTTKLKAGNFNATYSADQFLKTSAAGALSWAAGGGGFISYTVYTGDATWTKTDNNPTKIVVEVQGGGGSSGSGDIDWSYGGSGGSGGYVRKYIDVSSLDTAAIVVGAGGVKNAGTSAGNSSWTDNLTTNTLIGGAGGNGTNGVHPSPEHGTGGTGGSAAGGDLNMPGSSGAVGNDPGGMRTCNSPLSSSGAGFSRTDPSYGVALIGPAYGGGAARGQGNNATIDGADGGVGVVIIWEYK